MADQQDEFDKKKYQAVVHAKGAPKKEKQKMRYNWYMALNFTIKSSLFIVSFVVLTGLASAQQDDPTMRPSPTLKDSKNDKKAAKEEEKVHEKSKKELAKQQDVFDKKKYKKRYRKEQKKANSYPW